MIGRERGARDETALYGFTKWLGEEICRNAWRRWGIHTNALRLCHPTLKEKWMRETQKGVTTIISERFGKGALMWWSENCVYEAIKQLMKHNKKPVDEIQQFEDDLKFKQRRGGKSKRYLKTIIDHAVFKE
jgi:hypothetical protein